jgi:hypothetical protein
MATAGAAIASAAAEADAMFQVAAADMPVGGPESDREYVPEAEHVLVVEHVPEAEHVPVVVEYVPEAEHVPEVEHVPEAEHVPVVVEHVPVVVVANREVVVTTKASGR